jgi:DNA (cytosine-5)-methyltransferase 1
MASRKYTPTAKGYFSGAGGMEIGLMQAGVNIIQSLDIDTKATDCMKRNDHYFSHKIINDDIKNLMVLQQKSTDIVVGTYPCTKYSTMANLLGTRTGDDLYLHFFRHVVLEHPEMYILENVPGMKKFKVVMEAMTRIPGYYVNVFCPVDAMTWLPQKRKRLIVVGTKKNMPISAPTNYTRIKLKDIIEDNPDVAMPDYVLNRVNGNYRDKPIVVDPADPDAIAPTCLAHYSKDLGTRMVVDKKSRHGVRPFSIREYARLQGFPDDYRFEDKLNSYNLIGNAVPVPMGRWVGMEAMKYFN